MIRRSRFKRVDSAEVIRRRIAHHVRSSAGGGEVSRREVGAVAAVVVTDAVGSSGIKLQVETAGAIISVGGID